MRFEPSGALGRSLVPEASHAVSHDQPPSLATKMRNQNICIGRPVPHMLAWLMASPFLKGIVKVKTLRMRVGKAVAKKAAPKAPAKKVATRPGATKATADAEALDRLRLKTRRLSLSADRLLARLA